MKPGLFTTIQDLGRKAQMLGVSPSGAMDRFSHCLANWLVGNEENMPTIEVTTIGPTLLFLSPAVISITGADLNAMKNGIPIKNGKVIQIETDDVLSFGQPNIGSRSYIGIHGGIQVPLFFSSASTDVRSHLGKSLQANDQLLIRPSLLDSSITWGINPQVCFKPLVTRPVRFVKGKQFDQFNRVSKSLFQTDAYQVTSQSNRMGYRLDGPPLQRKINKELVSEGVSFGTVQVTPSGMPMILMADRQTMGGYPKIAQISSIDLPFVAQRQIGDYIQFKEISVADSQQLLNQERRELYHLKKIIQYRAKGAIHSPV